MSLVGQFLNLTFDNTILVRVKIVKAVEAMNSCAQMIWLEGIKEPLLLDYEKVKEVIEQQEWTDHIPKVKVTK